jgi:hypothetical protein
LVFASPEGVKLPQDLGVASEQSGHEDHQEADDDGFDDDESFHHQPRVVRDRWWSLGLMRIML